MTGAQIIGKVGVKLVPDLTGFRPDARSKLEKVERQLPKIKVEARFSDAGLKASLVSSLRALNAQVRNDDRFKVRLGTKIEARTADVRSAVRELNKLAKPERIRFRADVSAVLIEGELDHASMWDVEKQLKDWRDDISPLKVIVRPEFLNGTGTAIATRLKILTRPRTVSIIPVIDSKAAAGVATTLAALAGARVLWDTLDGLWDRLKRLDKAVPLIGTIAEAVAGLGALSLGAAGNLFSLSASLAQIAPAALVLPGIYSGVALGVGAMVAALKDFNAIFPDVKDKLGQLQDGISEQFWAGAEAPMRRMIDVLFPLLLTELTATGAELGKFFGSLGDSVTNILAPAMSGMFKDLHESIAISTQFTDAFIQVLTVLGTVGAGYLPRLAQWFGEIAQSFGSWLTEVQADGRLTAWIEHGIFAGLAQISEAAGGSTLTTFANTLQSIEDTVKGSTFQTVMVAALNAAYDGMARISNIAGPSFSRMMTVLGTTAAQIFPIMGATVGNALRAIFSALAQPEVSAGLLDLFTGLQAGYAGIAPALAPVGRALGAVLSLAGSLAAVIGPLLGAVLGGLADTLVAIGPGLEALIGALGTGLLGAIQSLSGPLRGLGSTIATAFAGIAPSLAKLAPVMSSISSAVLPKLIEGFGAVVAAVAPLIGKIAEFIALIAPVLVPVLSWLAGFLIDTLVMAIEGVVGVVGGLIDVISGLITFVVGVFTGDWGKAWEGIKQIFSGVIDFIVGAFKLFLSVGVLNAARMGLAALRGVWTGAWNAIKGAAEMVWNGIRGGFAAFGNSIRSLAGLWLNTLRGIWTTAWNAIKSVVTSVWNGIKSTISSVVGSVSSTVSGGFSAIRGFIGNAMSTAKSTVSTAFTSIVNSAKAGINQAVGWVAGLPGRALSALAGIGNLLYNAGSSLIQGFLDGITSKIKAVKDKLGELTAMIPKIKGPLPYDRVMLVPAGRAVMEGFLEGLDDGWDDVQKSLRRMTDEVAGTEMDGPSVNFRTASTGLSGLVDGALDSSSSGSGRGDFHYHAAPGNSLPEEDLFAATERGRMVGW